MDPIVRRLLENHKLSESIDVDTLMSTDEDNIAGILYEFSIGTIIKISDSYGIISYKKIKGDAFQEHSSAGLYGEAPRNFKVYDSEGMASIMMRAYNRGNSIQIGDN